MIAARIGDDSTAAFAVAKGSDLVVRTTQFESANGLQVFEFEEELALLRRACPFEKGSVDSYTVEELLGLVDVSESYDGSILLCFLRSRR